MSFFAIFMPKSFLGPIGKALNTYNWNRILGFVFFSLIGNVCNCIWAKYTFEDNLSTFGFGTNKSNEDNFGYHNRFCNYGSIIRVTTKDRSNHKH